MSCLGVHFALSADDVASLLSRQMDDERLALIQEDIERRYFEEFQAYVAESDKAWDAMHRALSDGLLSDDGGRYPLNHVVLGGQSLYGRDDYIVRLKTPEQVRDVALAVMKITPDQFRPLYDAIDPEDYGLELTDEDFQYTWDWFQGVRVLYQTAASEGRHVLFTVDQ
ncbi:YfbM family protein [uncultured Xanthomonas sp.]|uniref:YfbM family protein n=1 Tax=uncultured Xanthomonas sp. TaxID=152831 RepID=UPI0025EB3C86|nr:YfbM family protein [uncultured Xanthomonas sp.]